MRKLSEYIVLICIVLGISTFSAHTKAAENPVFGYTHLMQSPLTLPAGRLVYGVDTAMGLTDFLQVGTNVLRDFFRIYNANAKLSFIDSKTFAFALTGGFETYNLKDLSDSNPDTRFTSFLPGLVMAFALAEPVALFLGGNWNISNPQPVTTGIVKSGYLRGANVSADLSWAYNPPSKKLKGVGNLVSMGMSYDITYKLFGVGLSHHWRGFHLGAHYYVNADKNKWLPIIAGGGVVDF
ncbi:MAG: hypothetical protein AB7F43_03670 [Bacteriovoracia bacterium]